MTKHDLRHSDVTGEVLGAAFEVHNLLGPGFLESVYETAMAHELTLRGLRVERQVEVPIYYKEIVSGKHILDLVVENKVIVELKAVSELADVHSAIVKSYLSATGLEVALLLNFATPSLQRKRIIRSISRSNP